MNNDLRLLLMLISGAVITGSILVVPLTLFSYGTQVKTKPLSNPRQYVTKDGLCEGGDLYSIRQKCPEYIKVATGEPEVAGASARHR